jgi:ribosomal-protein-alanine N-acetyltransferase
MAGSEITTAALSIEMTDMTEHDLLEVVEIEQLAQLSPWGWDAYHKELQSPEDVIMLVARIERTSNQKHAVAGFIVSRLIAGELHINNVAVRPEFRRREIASSLVNRVLSAGRRKDARVAFLEVREGNTSAQGLYRRCGFTVTGRRKLYYQNPAEDALLMALFLETSP